MKKIYENLLYYYLLFIVFVFPIIPKEINTVLKIIPLRIFLILIFVVIFIYDTIFRKNKIGKANHKFWFLPLLLLFFMLLGIFVALDKVLFLYTFCKFLAIFALIYIISRYKFDKKAINNIFDTLLLSATITCIIGIVQLFLRTSLNYNGITKYPGAIGRIESTFHNPIYLAMFLFVASVVVIYKLYFEEKKYKKYGYMLYLLIYMITMFLTYTRSVAIIYSIFIFIATIYGYLKKEHNKFVVLIPFISFVVLIFCIPGVKYLYSSTLISVLPPDTSAKILIFANKNLKMDFDLDIYRCGEQSIFDCEEKSNDNVIKNNDKVVKNNGKVTKNNDEVEKNNKDVEKKDNGSSKNNLSPSKEDYSFKSRNVFINMARKISNDNYYIGIGLGNYKNYALEYSNKYIVENFGYPHNIFEHIKAESGIFAYIIFKFLFIFIIGITFLYFIIRKNTEYIFLFLLLSLMYLFGYFESYLYDTQFAILLVISATLLYKISKNKNVSSKNMFICSIGGHLTQMLQLSSLLEQKDSILITEQTDVSINLQKKYKMEFLQYGSRQYKTYPFILFKNTLYSLFLFIKYNPKNIITTGTHTAVPMCYIGYLFNRKIIYIESYAKSKTPTLSGRLVYPIANTFVIQWKSMQKHYPKAVYWGRIY